MIEFDESMYLEAAVSDKTLELIFNFWGPDVRDLFLYGGDAIVEPHRPAV